MAGRPRKFKTVEEMEQAIDNYFQECKDNDEPITVTGLALAIGFEDRCSLLDYCNYKDEEGNEFSHSVKKAKTYVEQTIEKGLLSGKYNATGAIFNLKNNYGWRDKQEVEQSGESKLTISLQGDVGEWAK